MSRFASSTTVNSSKSRSEIEHTLTRYGATGFIYGWDGNRAIVGFKMNDRQIKFLLPLPDMEEFAKTPGQGRERSTEKQMAAHEQASRQRWRALALVIKAKLEAVESGITEFDDEFMAHIVLPNGSTVGQFMKPQINQAYSKGTMPKLLPGPS